MTSPIHSLRWRLQVWHGAILFVAILALCLTVHQLATFNQLRRIDRDLGESEHVLIRSLVKATRPASETEGPVSPAKLFERLRDLHEVPATLQPRFSGTEAGHSYFIIQDKEGNVLLKSDNAPVGRTLLPPTDADFNEAFRTIDHYRESLRTARDGVASLVGRDFSTEQEEMHRFTVTLATCGLGIWFIGLLGGWWLAGRAIAPIADISRTATRIAEGNLDQRINISGTDSELDQLSRVLNQTFDRLHASFERQRRFTSDAAHELRTPVSILLSETQRILKRDREIHEYREALDTCQQSATRMRQLIESLLLLTRQEASDLSMQHQPCDLASIAREVTQGLQPLANEKAVSLHLNFEEAPCRGDVTALSILVTNLVANAIQHHRHGGEVWVETKVTDHTVRFCVRDNGPGIADEHLPHIFERFYRADQARTGSTGHTGLGLAIAKTIAENHEGTLSVTSDPGRETCFTLTLPADDQN